MISPPRNAIRNLRRELREGVERTYKGRLHGLYLYGSFATGEQDGESDFDVLIVLDRIGRYAEEIERTGNLIASLSLKYGVSISRVFLTKQDWQGGGTPFLTNARREAVSV